MRTAPLPFSAIAVVAAFDDSARMSSHAAFFAGALRWLIAILILAGAIRVAVRMPRRRSAESKEELEGHLDSSRGL